MKVLMAAGMGLMALLTACGQPMTPMASLPVAPAAQAQSVKVVKTTAKAMLTASFAALDKNSDKTLDRAEFVMMTGLPFELADLSRDGTVSIEEFTSDVAVANFGKTLRHLAGGVARALDTDKDKRISETEFLAAFAKADPTTLGLAKTAYASTDRRHDGKLGAIEFEDLFVRLVQNGSLGEMPQPVFPAPKPPAPKPPVAPAPGTGGGTPAPAPAPGGNITPAPIPGNGAPKAV
jgi:Ca2+-binding EF-hand superfamily protein